MEEVIQTLFSLQDEVYRKREEYREFQARVVKVAPESIIGVRTPLLRKLAREMADTPEAEKFMTELPHTYYEEMQLHGFLISLGKDFEKVISDLNRFLPYITTWATCDGISPKIFLKHRESLLPVIKKWLDSGETYTIRFAILCLMNFYLTDAFAPEYPEMVAEHSFSEEYYVRMMVAWYFATALSKRWEETIIFIENRRMSRWTHNKAIQKAIESYRITPDRKSYLRRLKQP